MATKKASSIPPEKLALYQKALAAAKIERKGDTNPYTSVNGHMFTHLDPSGSLGVRLSPEDLDAFLKEVQNEICSKPTALSKRIGQPCPTAYWPRPASYQKHFAASYRYTASLKKKSK